MKNIILLEDKPKRLREFISKTNKSKESNQLEVEQVLYYNPDLAQESEEVQELKRMLEVDVKVVNIWNFDDTLNELFEQTDNLFIFDTDINEDDEVKIFTYRINVSFALRKQREGRIWFYTVSGPDFEENIRKTFPKEVIQAELDENQQLDLKWKECESFEKALYTTEGV